MAHVCRDPRSPKGVWYCHFQRADGRRTFRSTGTKNKSRAKTLCDSWQVAEYAARDGTLSASRGAEIINEMLRRLGQEPVVRIRLGEWLDEWLETKANVSPQLLKRYRFARDQFLKFLGPDSDRRLLESVNEADMRKFVTHLRSEGRAVSTVSRIVHGDLNVAFNRAVDLGKIRYNPIKGVGREKDTERKARMTFSPEQIAKLIEASNSADWTGAILMGYTTGARLRDVTNIKWDSIDLNIGVIAFRQRKTAHLTDRDTVVGIHADFEAWLLRHVGDDPQADVFQPWLIEMNQAEMGYRTSSAPSFSALVLTKGRCGRGTVNTAGADATSHFIPCATPQPALLSTRRRRHRREPSLGTRNADQSTDTCM
jgi:hypothetical protein